MRVVATVRGHTIYSNLRVVSKTGSRITFADGSFVFLDSLSIVNIGTGRIAIEDPSRYGDHSQTGLEPCLEDASWQDEEEDDEDCAWGDDEDLDD